MAPTKGPFSATGYVVELILLTEGYHRTSYDPDRTQVIEEREQNTRPVLLRGIDIASLCSGNFFGRASVLRSSREGLLDERYYCVLHCAGMTSISQCPTYVYYACHPRCLVPPGPPRIYSPYALSLVIHNSSESLLARSCPLSPTFASNAGLESVLTGWHNTWGWKDFRSPVSLSLELHRTSVHRSWIRRISQHFDAFSPPPHPLSLNLQWSGNTYDRSPVLSSLFVSMVTLFLASTRRPYYLL